LSGLGAASAGAVTVGAMLGGMGRYLADWWWQRRRRAASAGDAPADPAPFPWATWTVNVIGSLLLGLIVGLGWQGLPRDLAATGFCGALTTYSTLSFELLRHVEENLPRRALTYATATLVAGLAAAAVGLGLGRWWG
jgi:CrcB protein